MIESSFSYSSLWDSEPLQDFTAELPLTEFDNYVENLERSTSNFGNLAASADWSCSSSDQDNGLIFEGLDFLPVTDSFISQILDDESISADKWPWLDNEKHSSPIENNLDSVKKSPKKAEKKSNCISSKAWSKMSAEEQIKTLHALSEIVTCQMEIREQIEIIKIIDPSVTILPDDKEFALDISHLNNSKMKRIRDYVQKVGYSLSSSTKKLNSSSKNSYASKKPSPSRKLISGKINSRIKKRQKKQKESTDEDSRKKRKLELHGLKEVRSGLFVYEKVIKLSDPSEEDEDVNILE